MTMLAAEPNQQLNGAASPTGRFSAILREWRWWTVVLITLIVSIVPAVLWPGSMNWMQDEPKLLGNAALYNQAHYVADHGLYGNFGMPYGPFPTMCYQFILLFTHDLRIITFIRAFLSSAILAGSLLWIGRTLKLWPWFVMAIMLAPYLVWTERDLWDATFAVPLGALAVAGYASFLKKDCGISLAIAVFCGTMVPFIHPQG